MYIHKCLFIYFVFFIQSYFCLYPYESQSRNKISLNGLWDFKVDFNNEGFNNQWFQKIFKYELDEFFQVAVPSSFNELYTNNTIRNHIGWVWYNRQFFINDAIKSRIELYSVSLIISSCNYYCVVWLNGIELGTHESGHLPFEFNIDKFIAYNEDSTFNLVIAVNNTLTPFTIPPAQLFYGTNSSLYPPGYVQQILQMDFYNYAGLHREVMMYIKPFYSINDIKVKTDYDSFNNSGSIQYEIIYECPGTSSFTIMMKDKNNKIIAISSKPNSLIRINNAIAWWPRGIKSKEHYGYLYKMDVKMECSFNSLVNTDSYSLDIGIRSISWSSTKDTKSYFKINNEDFYCKGVNKHEDFAILGRGIDLAVLIKDVYLFNWLNINCIRTSHYPYTEEFLQLTDLLGIAVLDEVPAVGLTQPQNFGPVTLALHKSLINELYNRDKNHPSVIMWSLANEPASNLKQSYPYFQDIFDKIRQLDDTRPCIFTVSASIDVDLCANLSDIISLNRYYGWYLNTGRLDTIAYQLKFDIKNWYERYSKPIMLTEYGADAVAGIHCYPESMFCEEYQTRLLEEHHQVFDYFKNKSILFGELIWNFADFMTDQDLKRVYGNHKGLFTRERQPKPSAFLLKSRYERMN